MIFDDDPSFGGSEVHLSAEQAGVDPDCSQPLTTICFSANSAGYASDIPYPNTVPGL